jgi:hypothetical protein
MKSHSSTVYVETINVETINVKSIKRQSIYEFVKTVAWVEKR